MSQIGQSRRARTLNWWRGFWNDPDRITHAAHRWAIISLTLIVALGCFAIFCQIMAAVAR